MMYSIAELYEYALQPEHIASIHPAVTPSTVSDTGALSVSSGLKTGRTPKEKRVVLDDTTRNVIHLKYINGFLTNTNYRPSGGVTSTSQLNPRGMLETEREQLTS